MAKTRVEVDEAGDFYIVIPTDIVEDLVLDQGDVVEWYVNDGYAELYFG